MADEPAVECKSEHYLNCSVEDTNEGCYRDISYSLQSKGFKRVIYRSHKKYNKVEKKIRRIPLKDIPLFIWTIAEKDVDFPELKEDQIVNHFEGITNLTTKMGFCDILRDLPSISADMMEVSPRSYNIGDPTHREEFIEDFNITAATNILKYYFYQQYNNHRCNNTHTPVVAEGEIKGNYLYYSVEKNIKNCIKCITMYLRVKLSGEWPGVERSFPEPDVPKLHGLDEKEWQSIRETEYFIADNIHFGENITASAWFNLIVSESLPYLNSKFAKVWLLLRGLYKVNKQLFIDGTKNIWIVKAPDTCCGVGIKLLYRLADIIECEKGMGGRTVQKYIESPLLAFIQTPNAAPSTPCLTKFDLRIWVLVTSMEPLKVYIYSTVYGRHCVYDFNLSVKSLGDNSIHLTNYSIQRKSNTNSDGENVLTGINAIRRLRGSIANNNSSANEALISPRSSSSQSIINTQTDLLLTHREILDIVGENNWNKKIWPGIKASICSTLKVSKEHVKHREKSFEFLGYDVLIDELYNPWILEVNMSPALAHRCDSHNNVIKKMADGIINLTVLPHLVGFNSVDADVGSWEVLFDESVATQAEVLNVPKPTPTVCNSNITYTTITNDEWNVVTPIAKRRPKSANASCRPKSASATSMVHSRLHSALQSSTTVQCDTSALLKNISSNIDISFMVTGKAISNQSIEFFDLLISNYFHMLALQRWSKKVLVRIRLYHSRRRGKSIVIQKYYRRHTAICLINSLRRRRSATYIQCIARMYLAKLSYLRRVKCRAAIVIQCRVRKIIACNKVVGLRRQFAKNKIVLWYRRIIQTRRLRASMKIQSVCKSWLYRRKVARRIINKVVASYYRRLKLRVTLSIQKNMFIIASWYSRHWLRWNQVKRRQCKIISGMAMSGLDLFLRKNEINSFHREDTLGAILRNHIFQAPSMTESNVHNIESAMLDQLDVLNDSMKSPVYVPPEVMTNMSPASPFENMLDNMPTVHHVDNSRVCMTQRRITYNKQKDVSEMDSIDSFVSKYGRVTASDLRLMGIHDTSHEAPKTSNQIKVKTNVEKSKPLPQSDAPNPSINADTGIQSKVYAEDEERFSRYALSYNDTKDPETTNSILQMQTMLKYYKSNSTSTKKASNHLRPTSASESRKIQSLNVRSLIPENNVAISAAAGIDDGGKAPKSVGKPKKPNKKNYDESHNVSIKGSEQVDVPRHPVDDEKWFQAVWHEFGPSKSNNYSNFVPPIPSQPKPQISRPVSASGTKKGVPKSNPNYLYEYSGINHIDYQFNVASTTVHSYGTENNYYSSNRGVDIGFDLDSYDDKNLRKIKKKKKEKNKPSTFSNYIFEHPFL